jgi:hypothetical protein
MASLKHPVVPETDDSLYDRDFFAWTQSVGEQLLAGRVSQADLERIAEEISDMGKRDRSEVHSRMVVLIMHLIKWVIQPERRENSTWRSTIVTQRRELTNKFRDSPSLRPYAMKILQEAYSEACDDALEETCLQTSLPGDCPYTMEQVLQAGWYPPDR